MDSSTKQFSLFLLLLTLLPLFQTHARENQHFNKASSTATTAAANAVPEPNQPKFLPDNGNTYGLYAHDSSQLPSTTTAAAVEKPLHDYFPNNYNAAALDDTNEPAFTKQNNYYNGGGSSFNSRPFGGGGGFQQQGMSDTRFLESGKYFYDVNTERYGIRNHPYQVLPGDRARNEYYDNNNFYGNNRNADRGYQNPDIFDDEVDNLP